MEAIVADFDYIIIAHRMNDNDSVVVASTGLSSQPENKRISSQLSKDSAMVEMNPKVGLMILGAQKCSTTTLFYLLKNHPQMCASRIKETNFFITATDWRKDIAQYASLFEPKPGQILFEASTAYTFYPLRRLQIWEDMYAYNPDMKFIYLVRNPIERIISAYMHLYLRGYTDLNIHEALKKEYSLLAVTRYYTQIIPFIRQFGRERVLIIDADGLHQERQEILTSVAEFLGISASHLVDQPAVHKNPSVNQYKRHHKWDHPKGIYQLLKTISPKIYRRISHIDRRKLGARPHLTLKERKMIIDILDLEIENLEKVMNTSFEHWRAIGQYEHV